MLYTKLRLISLTIILPLCMMSKTLVSNPNKKTNDKVIHQEQKTFTKNLANYLYIITSKSMYFLKRMKNKCILSI